MKRIYLIAAVAASTFATAEALAQPAPEAAPSPPHLAAPVPPMVHGAPPPPPHAGPGPRGRHHDVALRAQAASVEGRVLRLLINPFGEVDGVLLDSGMIVRTPPHLDGETVAVAVIGAMVRVDGAWDGAQAVRASAVTNVATGAVVVDRPPSWTERRLPPHLRGVGLSSMTVSGVIERVLTGPRGEPNGVLLQSGAIVRFGPREGYRVAGMLQPGAELVATGYGTTNQFGQALEATAIGRSEVAMTELF